MPLPRLLLPLCGLLFALAVTAATAGAPTYGPGEVRITLDTTLYTRTWDAQSASCSRQGGSLVPMVTDAVYMAVVDAIDDIHEWKTFGYMGGSTLLSSSACTTSAPSLDCIWYWDQGRYEGADNAVAFYRGNRDPSVLPGAGTISTTVSNFWGVLSSDDRCPCSKMQRYSGVVRLDSGVPFWSDTNSTGYTYSTTVDANYNIICAIEQSTTTTTTTTTTPAPTPAPTTTTTTAAPVNTTTTAAQLSEALGWLNPSLMVCLSVASAAVVVVLVVLVSLSPLRWSPSWSS